MRATATKTWHAGSELHEIHLEAPRTRISRRRVFGLAFPALLLVDALLVAGGFLAAIRISPVAMRALQQPSSDVTPPLIALFVVLAAGFFTLGGMFGLYSHRLLVRPRLAVATAVRALWWSGIIAVAFAFLLALDPPGNLRRLLVLHALFLAAGVMTIRPVACRLFLRLAEVGPIEPRRLLIVGGTHEAARVAAALESADSGGTTVIGLADPQQIATLPGQRWPRFPLVCGESLPGLAHALAADEVLIATRSLSRGEGTQLAARLAEMGIETHVVPHLTRMYVDAAPVKRDLGVPQLRLGGPTGRAGSLEGLKRAADVVLASAMCLAILPLVLVIAALVKLTSRGPVFYAQTRIGKSGKPFRMFKFRSMIVSNDDSDHREYVATLVRQGDAAGFDPSGRPVYKIFDDPRITLLGKVLRRTSLDELPQLLNVLRGEMSLVGPRPCLPFEYDLYESWQRRRLEVTPGMTGLWQVSGRSFLSFEEMVLLDLYYAANWSFLLDLKILWRTIPEVLYARGTR